MVDGFGNDAHAELLADLRHDAQTFFAEALKRVRGSARLVGAAAEELGSRALQALRHTKCLLAAFDRARTSDDGEAGPADGGRRAGKTDDGVFFLHVTADQLVGLSKPV